MADHLLAGPTKVAVASVSKSLAQLGFAVPSGVSMLKFLPRGDGRVRFAYDTAAVFPTAAELPLSGLDLPVTQAEGLLLTFIAESDGISVTIIATGPAV